MGETLEAGVIWIVIDSQAHCRRILHHITPVHIHSTEIMALLIVAVPRSTNPSIPDSLQPLKRGVFYY